MILPVFLSFSMYAATVKDSLPPLHTLMEDSIESINPSFEDDVINIRMKNGNTLRYTHVDWDLEDENPKTGKRIQDAIHHLTKTFTKVEISPAFPWGEGRWQEYLKAFCESHKKEIRKAGKGVVYVQFIVHLQGQLREIQPMGDGPTNPLTELALQAVRESGRWTPAVQNGRQVVSYHKVRVDLTL